MVSFWPWKAGEDAASFEKTLSTLSAKISKAAASNDGLRQRSRRIRVMWTLYAGFAYILAVLLLLLVTGWRSWGAVEITIVSGGPVIIYLVRTSLTIYYDWRISKTQTYLEKLNKERDAAIERLKAATKYNTTQQLLEKYGSSPKPKDPPSSPSQKMAKGGQNPTQPGGPRTGIAPPPTANIQRPTIQHPSNPQKQPSASPSPQGPSPRTSTTLPPDAPGAEFAPNAYESVGLTKQYSASTAATFTQSHWYDRILDALLGEDETQPKNRLALICTECRLVNGQAPPGTKSLEDVGRWRCSGCHAWNGKEKDQDAAVVATLMHGLESEQKLKEMEFSPSVDGGSDSDGKDAGDDVVLGMVDGSSVVRSDYSLPGSQPPSRTTRSKSKGKGKK